MAHYCFACGNYSPQSDCPYCGVSEKTDVVDLTLSGEPFAGHGAAAFSKVVAERHRIASPVDVPGMTKLDLDCFACPNYTPQKERIYCGDSENANGMSKLDVL